MNDRTYFACCIGTYRPVVAKLIRFTINRLGGASNNCEVVFRGRRPKKSIKRFFYTVPLKDASRYAIYIQIKRGLDKKMRKAEAERQSRYREALKALRSKEIYVICNNDSLLEASTSKREAEARLRVIQKESREPEFWHIHEVSPINGGNQ